MQTLLQGDCFAVKIIFQFLVHDAALAQTNKAMYDVFLQQPKYASVKLKKPICKKLLHQLMHAQVFLKNLQHLHMAERGNFDLLVPLVCRFAHQLQELDCEYLDVPANCTFPKLQALRFSTASMKIFQSPNLLQWLKHSPSLQRLHIRLHQWQDSEVVDFSYVDKYVEYIAQLQEFGIVCYTGGKGTRMASNCSRMASQLVPHATNLILPSCFVPQESSRLQDLCFVKLTMPVSVESFPNLHSLVIQESTITSEQLNTMLNKLPCKMKLIEISDAELHESPAIQHVTNIGTCVISVRMMETVPEWFGALSVDSLGLIFEETGTVPLIPVQAKSLSLCNVACSAKQVFCHSRTFVDLEKCVLQDFSSDALKCSKLKELRFTNMKETKISFDKLPLLKCFSMVECESVTLSSSLLACKQLNSVTLMSCGLVYIPEVLFQLPSLTTLNLDGNAIYNIDTAMASSCFPALESLSIQFNPLAMPQVVYIPQLQILRISYPTNSSSDNVPPSCVSRDTLSMHVFKYLTSTYVWEIGESHVDVKYAIENVATKTLLVNALYVYKQVASEHSLVLDKKTWKVTTECHHGFNLYKSATV